MRYYYKFTYIKPTFIFCFLCDQVNEAFACQLQKNIDYLMLRLETEYNVSTADQKDYTIYTGTTGETI